MSNMTGLYNADSAKAAGEGGEYKPLPAGDYKVLMTESEMKDTAKGGKMLAMTFVVADGEHKEKKFFGNLNLVNANETAQNIAHRDFGLICEQVGVKPEDVNDSSDLHMKPFMVTVKIAGYTGSDGQPKSKNEVASYKPKQAVASPSPTTAPAANTAW